jgi:hypothetical protein
VRNDFYYLLHSKTPSLTVEAAGITKRPKNPLLHLTNQNVSIRAMPEYQELDVRRNEIRLLTVLGLTSQYSKRRKLVECTLEHFSLNEYTPEYSRFLKIEEGRSATSLSVLWDQLTQGEDPLINKVAQQQTTGLWHESLPSRTNRSLYSNQGEYNENTTRWTWGDYDALSYYWGDPNDKRDIVVNKQKFPVNKNLEKFLRHYVGWKEEHGKHTRIWTDAVCINQNDIPERSLQIKRMKDIYQQAHTVLAWIGTDLVHGDLVQSLINEVEDVVQDVDPTSPSTHKLLYDFVQGIPSRYDDSVWKGVVDLMSRPYWGRLWIIQEILLANPKIGLCFDNRYCPISSWFLLFSAFQSAFWSHVMPKVEDLFSSQPDSDLAFSTLQRNFTQIGRLVTLDQYKYTGSPWPSLIMLLSTGQHAEQMEPKDKVYALLGLMDPAIQDLVTPNYHATELQIYRDFVRSATKVTRKLNIIFQGASQNAGSEGFPSWLPDWSVRNDDGVLELLNNGRFCATRTTEHVDRSDENGNESHLLCEGLQVDVIDSLGCGGTLGTDHTAHDVVPSTLNASAPNPYGDDEGVRNALWEMFTIGRLPELTPAVSSLLKALPWFDKNTAESDSESPIYDALDQFQQCNSDFQIAGKSLEHYFPPWSKDFGEPPDDPSILSVFHLLMLPPLLDRRLMTTKKGYMGFVPKNSVAGDLIFVLMGCDVPLVLRSCEIGGYRLVGECYVHGIMKGEAMEALDEHVLKTVTLC